MATDIKLPRMARIGQPHRFDGYVFLEKAYLVLNQTLLETLIEAMVEEAFWRATEEKKESLT